MLTNKICEKLIATILYLTTVAVFVLVAANVRAGEVSTAPYWVYFKDKGLHDAGSLFEALARAETNLTPKARDRRMKMGRPPLVDEVDLPVHSRYAAEIERIAERQFRCKSRWLNAVSFDLTREMLQEILRLAFVERIVPVRSFIRAPLPDEAPDPAWQPHPRRDWNLDYGNSLRQNLFMNVPAVHDLGLRGRGVLIGSIDAGFNNLDHNCFQRLNVVAAYDFLNDDNDVADGEDMGRGEHGTKTLSIIAGYDPGQMIGIAYEADFALAKTENSEWERPVEEDYWVAAIEWMDELGVEVVTSSLAYANWYDYEDMDGNTGVTTVAADRAAAVGMIVVISMGNSGRAEYPANKMGAPADGDSVFSVGATNQDSSYAAFSSYGPTYDGRIKPDFTTIGVSVRVASDREDDVYAGGAGTSFSAPAVAGVCALMLQANPYLTPMDVRDALREASDRRQQPDTLYGWGIPNALLALREGGLPESRLTLDLRSGWSTVSHNLTGVEIDIRAIFAPIVERDNLLLVKDGEGNFYFPDEDFSNIPFWKGTYGYQVKVNETDSLVFEGRLAPYNQPIPLEQGWHIVSYLPEFAQPAESAFELLVMDDLLDMVKDDSGRFYAPRYQFSNMRYLRPGRGYQIRLADAAGLIYQRRRYGGDSEQALPQPVYFPSPPTGESNMSLLALAGDGVHDGDEMGCFSLNGRIIGAGVFDRGKCGVAVWGDAEGAPFSLRYYSKERNKLANPAIDWVEGEARYASDEFAVIRVAFNDPDLIVPNRPIALEATPNPFNNRVVLQYSTQGLGKAVLRIFDPSGRTVAERVVGPAGMLAIDASGWAAGSYIVNLSAGHEREGVLIRLVK